MPFASKAQRGYLFEHNAKVAKEFAAATPKGAKLPDHVARSKRKAKTDAFRSYLAGMKR